MVIGHSAAFVKQDPPALRNALVAVDAVFDGFAKANTEAMQEVAPPGTSPSDGE